jgi:hypothetical protein
VQIISKIVIDRKKPKDSEINLPQCHFVYHKSRTN